MSAPTALHDQETTVGPVREHFEYVRERRICQCQCSKCYDIVTNEIDETCRCPGCECVNSDHSH